MAQDTTRPQRGRTAMIIQPPMCVPVGDEPFYDVRRPQVYTCGYAYATPLGSSARVRARCSRLTRGSAALHGAAEPLPVPTGLLPVPKALYPLRSSLTRREAPFAPLVSKKLACQPPPTFKNSRPKNIFPQIRPYFDKVPNNLSINNLASRDPQPPMLGGYKP